MPRANRGKRRRKEGIRKAQEALAKKREEKKANLLALGQQGPSSRRKVNPLDSSFGIMSSNQAAYSLEEQPASSIMPEPKRKAESKGTHTGGTGFEVVNSLSERQGELPRNLVPPNNESLETSATYSYSRQEVTASQLYFGQLKKKEKTVPLPSIEAKQIAKQMSMKLGGEARKRSQRKVERLQEAKLATLVKVEMEEEIEDDDGKNEAPVKDKGSSGEFGDFMEYLLWNVGSTSSFTDWAADLHGKKQERFLPLEGSDNRCLLCYNKPSGLNSSKSVSEQRGGSELESNVKVMFLLKRILELPKEQLSAHLKKTGLGPREWIRICSGCEPLVLEALDVNERILKLLKELKECKLKIVNKMKATYGENENYSRTPGRHSIHVTGDIRSFVFKRRYLKSNKFLKADRKVEIIMQKRAFTPAPGPQPSSPSIKRSKVLKVKPKALDKAKVDIPTKMKLVCPECPLIPAMPVDQFVQHVIFHFERPFKCNQCQVYLTASDTTDNTHWKQFHDGVELNKGDQFSRVTVNINEIVEWPSCVPVFPEENSTSRDKDSPDISHKPFKCKPCGTRFRSHDDLKLHFTLDHTKVASMSCYHCLDTFGTSDGVLDEAKLKHHMESKHPSVITLKDPRLNLCALCGLTCNPTKRVSHRHMELHHPQFIEKIYGCKFCKEMFPSPEQLEMHISHCSEKKEELDYVSDVGVTDDDVVRPWVHIAELHKTYSCAMCPLSGMTFDAFTVHLLFHKLRPLKCTECSTFLKNEDNVVANHWSRFHADSQGSARKYEEVSFSTGKVWECRVRMCEEAFCSEEERSEHHLSSHNNYQISEDAKIHKCIHCSRAFQSLEEWRLHRVLEHPEKAQFSCLICDTSFMVKTVEGVEIINPNRQIILNHINSAHKTTIENGKRRNSLRNDICEFCGETFPSVPPKRGSPKGLSIHLQESHKIPESQLFTCPVCPQDKHAAFKTRPSLYAHIKFTHFEKKIVCELCGWRGKSASDFQAHNFTQHRIRPEELAKMYKCTHEGCSYETARRNGLTLHIKTHFDVRPYICRFCGKGFKDSSKLKEHERIHTNKETKPFQCEICGNSFALRNYLYIHKRLSHEGRFFPSTHKKKPPRHRRNNTATNATIQEQTPSTSSVEVPFNVPPSSSAALGASSALPTSSDAPFQPSFNFLPL